MDFTGYLYQYFLGLTARKNMLALKTMLNVARGHNAVGQLGYAQNKRQTYWSICYVMWIRYKCIYCKRLLYFIEEQLVVTITINSLIM